MDIERFRDFCLDLKGVSEGFPFDAETLVFKVMGKMFALTDVDSFESVALKCEPEKAVELRERYPAVQPGYHMSKTHWNTVYMDGSISDTLIMEWTLLSYGLVVAGLTKKLKQELAEM